MRVVAGEVEDGAADDEVEGVVGVGDGFDGFDAEVFRGEVRGEGGGESAGLRDGFGILIGGEDLVAFAEEIDEIAARAQPASRTRMPGMMLLRRIWSKR